MADRLSAPRQQVCPCSARHSPPVTHHETDLHHSPPKSWPMALGGGTRRTDRLCATAHRRVHRLLNLYVENDGDLTAADLRPFRPIELELAKWSWENADHNGPAPLPRTLAEVVHG